MGKWRSAESNRHYGGVTYSPEEKRAHRAFAERQLRQAAGVASVVKRALREKFGMGPGASGRLVDKILAEWSHAAAPTETMRNRAQAIQRIRDVIQHATFETVPDPDNPGKTIFRRRPRPDYGAIIRAEQALMQLEGTNLPIKLEHEHNVLSQTVAVMVEMSAEEVQERFARRAEITRLAEIARSRLPELVDPERKPS